MRGRLRSDVVCEEVDFFLWALLIINSTGGQCVRGGGRYGEGEERWSGRWVGVGFPSNFGTFSLNTRI